MATKLYLESDNTFEYELFDEDNEAVSGATVTAILLSPTGAVLGEGQDVVEVSAGKYQFRLASSICTGLAETGYRVKLVSQSAGENSRKRTVYVDLEGTFDQ